MTDNLQITPENYLDLWDICPDAILVITERKEIAFANSAAARLFHYSAEEIIGTPLNRIISGELPGFKDGLSEATTERGRLFKRQQLIAQCPQGKFQGIRKNRIHFPIELSLSTYRGSQGNVLALAILREITSEKKEEIRQRRVNETLYAVAQVIGSTLELDDVLHRILGQLKKVMNYQAAAIMLIDEEGKNLYVKVADGFNKEAVKISLPLAGEKGVGVQVVRTGEHEYVPDIAEDTRHVSGGIDKGSELAVPLKIKDEVIGVLNLESEEIDAFSHNDLQLLSAFAGQAAIAIENARLFEAEQSRRRLAETLGEVSRSVGSILDPNSLLLMILEQLKRILAYDTASIMLFAGRKPSLAATLGYEDKELVRREIPLRLQHSRIFKRMIRTRRPIIIRDVREEKDWIRVPGARHVHSWIGVPLVAGNKVIGVLSIDSNQTGFFTIKDVETVQALANQTAIAIQNARLFKDLNEEKGRLELLYDISRQFTSDQELDQMLARIIERVTVELGGLIGHLFTIEPDSKHLKLHAVAGVEVSLSVIEKKVRIHLDQGLAGWVALHRKPAVVPDVAKDSRWHYVDEIDREVRAVISVPLSLGEKTFGVLSIAHSEVDYFNNPVYLHLLTAISNQVAVTIEKALLYKQLKESEERFRYVTANTGDWVWEVDAEGRYTYSSAVVEQILGYRPEEVLGKHFYDFFLPADIQKLKAEALRTFEMRKPFNALVNRNLHRDGHTVIIETSGTPVITTDGQFTGYRGADHDITARVQAEQALASSEHKYRILVEHTDDWIWTLDLKGNFTFFNRAAEEATGYRCEEWVGQSFISVILPEELPDVKRFYSEILAGNSKSYEVRVVSKDGKLFTLAVNTAPLYEGSGIVGTVSMGRDVTMQKQLEEQLRQAQKMEAIGTLAGGIAHDFNNILGGILGYTSLIKTEIPENTPLRSELDAVISLVRRAAELTGQLLGFARGGRYQIEAINLNDIIGEVLKLLSRTIDKTIRIKPVLNPALAPIEGDAGQIHQVILNLCLNARDSMPGGGELLIETENIDIDEDSAGGLPGLEAGSYICFSVSDTGSGMDSETKARIFDPFFTTKEGKGMNKHSGLGLSMVYGIVHSHGGIIKVYSQVGEGTKFKIYLPVTERKVVKEEYEETIPAGGKETILVVDDEELILRPAEKILKRAGYKVLLANGGKKALNLLAKYHKEIDLVILDMIMPDMNGTATYNGIKEVDPGMKVLLSSGYSRNRLAQELLKSGVKDFLQKPYEFADMLIKVRQVLDGE